MSAAPALKPISMASGCLTSLPTHFASKTSHPFLSVPLRPIKPLHLSWPSSRSTLLQSLSVRKNSPLPPLVAQTSDLGELGEAPVSDWEGEDQSEGEIVAEGEPEADGFVEESHPDPPEEAKLFVGGLPFDMDSAKLAQLFNRAGVVEVAEVIYNRETDQSRGFGFVTMRTVEEAEKAVEMFHRYDAGGRLLTVNKAAPRGSRPERSPQESETSSLRIYVGNLPWQVDDSRLVQLFSAHGKVVDARVVQDRETGRSRGFGFVTMASKAELDDAVTALDGENLDGRPLRVNAAEERPRRGFF